MKRPCVLLLPNSSSEFFLGRCGDLKIVGLYIETDPCVRDGTDGTYELRLTKNDMSCVERVEKKGGDMIDFKSDLITFVPERLITNNESLARTLFPSFEADAASLIFGHLTISSEIKFSSDVKFKNILPLIQTETKGFRDATKTTNRRKNKTSNLSLSNGRMGKWMSSRRKDHDDLTNGDAVSI